MAVGDCVRDGSGDVDRDGPRDRARPRDQRWSRLVLVSSSESVGRTARFNPSAKFNLLYMMAGDLYYNSHNIN